MKEEKDSSPKKNQLPYLVARYEKMVADNGNLFFDVEEFEEILDHYMESGHFQTAIGVLACARSQHPAAMDFHFREAELLAITNRPKKALKVLREVESFESANPELYLTKATIYSQLGSSEKAIDLLRTALDYAAEDRDQIFLNMAFEYHNIGAHEQAIKCLKRALNVNPQNEEAVYELAYAFERADDMPSSAKYYERFVDAHPYNAPAWFNLGNTYSRLEKHEEALKAYDFATVIKEDFSAAHFNKGNVMSRMGLYHQAIEAYKSTLQHDLFDALTYYYIGDCYEKLMDFDKSEVFYRKATKSDPHMAEAWMGIGLVLEGQDRLVEGIHYIKKAVDLDQQNPDYWYILGESEQKLGFSEEAAIAFEEVIKLGYEDADIWLDYSSLFFEQRQPDQALEVLGRGIQLHPHSSELFYRAGAYLLAKGHEQEAMGVIEFALEINAEKSLELFEFYPDAAMHDEVLNLVESYKKP